MNRIQKKTPEKQVRAAAAVMLFGQRGNILPTVAQQKQAIEFVKKGLNAQQALRMAMNPEKFYGDYLDEAGWKGWTGYWVGHDGKYIYPSDLISNTEKFDWKHLPDDGEETSPSTNSDGKAWPHSNGRSLTYAFSRKPIN